jgi:hypothetical protein
MKMLKKILSITLIVVSIIQLMQSASVSAATYGSQPPPTMLDVAATKPPQPAIGYNALEGGSTGYYADFSWTKALDPNPWPSNLTQFTNLYVQEINKPYKPLKPTFLKDSNIPGSVTSFRMKDLSSGTIYYINAKAYNTYTETIGTITTTYTSAESIASNQVKVMTDIDISASSYGTNQIKIDWDDVWNTGRRIDYKLYISDNSAFANTLPIYIGQSEIGPNGPVKVNESSGKLEYIHTVNDAGRVYYVKIVPDIADAGLKMSPESVTVSASSYILVQTTKMSETDTGTIWRLDWSPVVTGLNNAGINVTYQIDKYDENGAPQPMLLESGTTTFILIPKGTGSNYFRIRANVTINGVPLYPSNIKIESAKILIKDLEVPTTPATPEIVNKFVDPTVNNGRPIISYEDIYYSTPPVLFKGELTANSATVLWRTPRKANGDVDTDVMYDIWLISDPNLIDNPPNNSKVATSIKMTSSNYIMDGVSAQPVGYKFKVSNLIQHSTYYFKIVAKKSYLEYQNGILANVEYPSQAALKVIITPAEGLIDQPLVPGRPPLKVKKLLDDPTANYVISDTEATIQLKNKWFEKFVAATTAIPFSHWEYDPTYNPFPLGVLDPYLDDKPLLDTLDKHVHYRKVEYDPGVTIDVGCVEYVEGMNVSTLNTLPANKVIGFSTTANDPDENALLNAPEQVSPPVYKKHNIDIKLTQLEPNTTYIIWVRASRQSANLISGPSDPIIITTNPSDDIKVEKPIVPTINYTLTGDTYVDLGWDLKANYNYYIKYGTVDDINQATGNVTTSSQEIIDSGISFYRVTGLSPNTLYYFWIQAEATNDTLTSKSDWSDSFLLKTLAQLPPNTPRGFGVKSPQADNVTKNSITFEWIKEEGMKYILEIAGGIDYTDVKQYTISDLSEFKVDNLRSNFRYFARLYAFDSTKNLKSQPTQSVTIRTLRSSDDYDSDQDIENVISGDFIVKDPTVIKGVWTIRIEGANADRFVEHVQNDKVMDYSIDVSSPPSKATQINLIIASKVFESLNGISENIRIITQTAYVIIRPNVLIKSLSETASKKLGNFNYSIQITSPSTTVSLIADNLTFKTSSTEIAINAYDGSNIIPIETLNKPLKISIPYSDNSWYKEGITSAYVYNNTKTLWDKVQTTNKFDTDNNKGTLTFETLKTGNIAVADIGMNYYDDINGNKYETSITSVAAVHNLKSIIGREFEPNKNASISDSVKLALDVLDYNYGSDYMEVAGKSRLIGNDSLKNPNGALSRQNAVAMTVRLYELKTGTTAQPKSKNTSIYSDLNLVDASLLPKVLFAIENGLIVEKSGNKLNPRETIVRGEFMELLEKLLALVGEID